MKLFAINGSPRKSWNTATMLEHAVKGAASEGAETELIHLYDLNFKGCKSCFACKTIGGKSFGKCAVKDELTPLLEEIPKADALILGSPIYYGTASGMMRMFMERLFYPFMSFDPENTILSPRKLNFGYIYTMNVNEEQLAGWNMKSFFSMAEFAPRLLFGTVETLLSTDTLQFDDYSKTGAGIFDPEHKARRHKEVFPFDCKKAFEMGARFIREPIQGQTERKFAVSKYTELQGTR